MAAGASEGGAGGGNGSSSGSGAACAGAAAAAAAHQSFGDGDDGLALVLWRTRLWRILMVMLVYSAGMRLCVGCVFGWVV
jgi:hypothetical protein